jgi:hypothetical protein
MKRVLASLAMVVFLAIAGSVGVAVALAPTAQAGDPQVKDPLLKETCAGGVAIALPFVSGGNKCVGNNPATGGAIITYLRAVLQVLSATVGAVIVLMVTLGGVQYLTSIGDPKRIAAAKDRVTNAFIALVLFLMMYAILNFIIPGGIL